MLKTHINLIKTLIKKNNRKIKRTVNIDQLFEDEAIGKIVGSYWILNDSDIETLTERASRKIGQDIRLDIDFTKSRTELALNTSNEKLSSENVFASTVLVARTTELPLPLISKQPVHTPHNTFFGCDVSLIDFNKAQKFMLLENGEMMKRWSEAKLPVEWAGSTFVYRGHGSNLVKVSSLLQSVPEHNKAGYFDFDLAGLFLALESGCSVFIAPADLEEIIEKSFYNKFNKLATFYSQSSVYAPRIDKLPSKLRKLAEFILVHKIAITQEHLTAHKVQLIGYEIS